MRAWLLLITLAAVPAGAHDFWIEPSTFHPAPGAAVSLGLRVGERFQGEALPRIPDYIERFVVRDGSGEQAVPGRPGGDPAGLLRAAPAGLAVALYQSRPYPTEVEAAKFEQYLKDEGLEPVAAIRKQRGETDEPAAEQFSRCAKALLRSGPGGAPIDTAFGCPVELVAETEPASSLRVRVLRHGQPLPNALVTARSKSNPDAVVQRRTDRQGRATLKLTGPGVWLVKSIHVEEAPRDSGVAWESFWASLIFEVP